MLPVTAASLQPPSACPQPVLHQGDAVLLMSSYKEEVGPGQSIKSVTKELLFLSHRTAFFFFSFSKEHKIQSKKLSFKSSCTLSIRSVGPGGPILGQSLSVYSALR